MHHTGLLQKERIDWKKFIKDSQRVLRTSLCAEKVNAKQNNNENLYYIKYF